jgi:hypothetical protein
VHESAPAEFQVKRWQAVHQVLDERGSGVNSPTEPLCHNLKMFCPTQVFAFQNYLK